MRAYRESSSLFSPQYATLEDLPVVYYTVTRVVYWYNEWIRTIATPLFLIWEGYILTFDLFEDSSVSGCSQDDVVNKFYNR